MNEPTTLELTLAKLKDLEIVKSIYDTAAKNCFYITIFCADPENQRIHFLIQGKDGMAVSLMKKTDLHIEISEVLGVDSENIAVVSISPEDVKDKVRFSIDALHEVVEFVNRNYGNNEPALPRQRFGDSLDKFSMRKGQVVAPTPLNASKLLAEVEAFAQSAPSDEVAKLFAGLEQIRNKTPSIKGH